MKVIQLNKPFLPTRFTVKVPNKIILADLDDTLIPWVKFRKSWNEDFLRGNQFAFTEASNKAIIGAVTGLDFMSVREIKDLLKGFPPFDFLSTDNGKIVYLNENDISPFGKWVAKVKPEEYDKGWEAYIKENTGWDRDLLFSVLERALQDEFFAEIESDGIKPDLAYSHCKIYKREDIFNSFAVFSKGESAVYMIMNPEVNIHLRETEMKKFGEIIKEKYKDISGKEIKFNISNHGNYFYMFFAPVGKIQIDKASIFDLIVSRLPKDKLKDLKAGIALGDSQNDKHLRVQNINLPLDEILNVPVYAIHSGDLLKDDEEFSKHPFRFFTEGGNIGRTLTNVLNKVDENA